MALPDALPPETVFVVVFIRVACCHCCCCCCDCMEEEDEEEGTGDGDNTLLRMSRSGVEKDRDSEPLSE